MSNSTELNSEKNETIVGPPETQEADNGVYVLPASINQQSLWFLDQLDPGKPTYNIPMAYQLDGILVTEVLEESINLIIQRHEALRTTFTLENGEPMQVIHPHFPIELKLHKPKGETDLFSRAEIQQFVTLKSNQPFDLGVGPLIRADLMCIEAQSHLLIFVFHHIIFDNWSADIFLKELAIIYTALVKQEKPILPELSLQYADFAVWQQELLAENALAEQVNYWLTQLKDAPPLTALPTDHPRPVQQTSNGQSYQFDIPPDLSEALQKLSRENNVTLYITLLTAFKVLLYRYSKQPDIIIGSPVAGREQAELEDVIGYFINMLVLRSNISGELTFLEQLKRVQQTVLAAQSNSSLPFERLVTLLKTERNPGYTPIYQIDFNFLIEETNAIQLHGLKLKSLDEVDTITTKSDLSLVLSQQQHHLKGSFTYNVDLFNPDTIKRMAGHFQVLLAGIIKSPEMPVSKLPRLTPAEYHQLVIDWNNTATVYPKDKCMHHLFEAQVEKTPDAVAVIFKDQPLSYRDLNQRANQLAHHLQKLGVGPDVLVGLYVDRSLEMVVALLAIFKAGGAYIPLDPAYPKDRLAFMIADANLDLLLTQHHLVPQLPPSSAKIFCLDSDWPQVVDYPLEVPLSLVQPHHLAYVIYTSGSTGKPKGVQIPHLALCNFLWSMAKSPGLSAEDTLLAVTTLSFDIATLELYLPLIQGAKIILADRFTALDGRALQNLLHRYQVTQMQATPATWRLLIDAGWTKTPRLKVLCGGEALPRQLAEQLLDRVGSLWNMYGPTETTVWSTICPVTEVNEQISIGRPIANTQIYILDEELQPVPVGEIGDLYIGGDGLARGYLNRPELTAEKFITHPQWQTRLYKTGDLARYFPDGNLEFLGRADFQVKIRGYRIELGDIETAISDNPAIKQAVVTVYQDPSGDKRLVAYLIAESQQNVDTSAVRHSLRQKLPDYMIPSFFISLNQFPLTPNGKIDRKALPVPESVQSQPEKIFVPPQTDLQLQLAKIWERVLGIKPIGLNDNFFELGGHSLLAVRLFAEIQKVFDRDLPLVTLFQAPTIQQLANLLNDARWTPPWDSLVPLQPHGTRTPFFCVHAVGGNVLSLRDLANHLGPDQPFYALQSQGLNGKAVPPTSVQEAAAHYIQEIRTVQPTGPYLLSGQSSGGIIAFEMAIQLTSQGEKVALLGLIDTYSPLSDNGEQHVISLKHKLGFHWQTLSQHGPSYLINQFKFQFKRQRRRSERGLITIAKKVYAMVDRPLPHMLRYISVRESIRWAVKNYEPQIYQGQITLFQATDTFDNFIGTDNTNEENWQKLTTQTLVVHNIDGPHNLEQEPFVGLLAQRLSQCLFEAENSPVKNNTSGQGQGS